MFFPQYFKTITFVCEIYPEKITSLDPGLQVNYYQSSIAFIICTEKSCGFLGTGSRWPRCRCSIHPLLWFHSGERFDLDCLSLFLWFAKLFFCRIYLLSFQVLGCHMIRQKAQVRMALSYVNIHYQMFSDYFSFSLGFSNLWATAPFSQALDGPYFKVEWIWMCSYGLRFKFHQYSGPIKKEVEYYQLSCPPPAKTSTASWSRTPQPPCTSLYASSRWTLSMISQKPPLVLILFLWSLCTSHLSFKVILENVTGL